MTNDNYKHAENALESVKLNNIKIKLHRGTNLKQCTNVTVYNVYDEILEERVSTSIFSKVEDFENLFLYKDKYYGLKKVSFDESINIQDLSKNLTQEIVNFIEQIYINMYSYNFSFRDNDLYLLSFCAYYGLLKNIKDFYLKKCKVFESENSFYFDFDNNKKYNFREIGETYGLNWETIRQKIERVLKYFKLEFLKYFEKNIYSINYILNNGQDYIILENTEKLKTYEKLLNELFKDYEANMSFYIDFSLGLIMKNNVSLENLMNDEKVSQDVRRKIEERFNKVSIYIDGKKLLDNRKSLMSYCMKTYCKEPTSLKDIQNKYKKMLIKNNINIKDREELIYDDRRLDNILAESHNTLLSNGKIYRYYKSEKMNELVNLIDLSIYKDVVISANKIYNDNLDLMKKFDIHNCYELHNLLNKKINDNNILFKKMPTICFGKADRSSQMIELLKELSPTDTNTLAKAYKNMYGDAENTILGSYLNPIARYKVGNKYIYN